MIKTENNDCQPIEMPQLVGVYPGDAEDGTEVCGASENVRRDVVQRDNTPTGRSVTANLGRSC